MRDEAPSFSVGVYSPSTQLTERVPPERCISFSFEDTELKADKATLTIDNYDVSQIGSPLWQTGNILLVQFGYVGSWSPEHTLKITKVKGFAALTIEALGATEMNMARQPRPDRYWESVKRSDVARLIAREYGFLDHQIFIEDTKVVLPQITQGPLDDHRFLRGMAAKEGFYFYVDNGQFHFHPRNLAQASHRVFEYFTGRGLGGGNIISLEMEDSRPPKKPGAIVVSHRDPATKTTRTERVTSDSPHALSSETTRVGIYDEPAGSQVGQDACMGSSATTWEGAKREAQARLNDVQQKGMVLTVQAAGDPGFLAKSVCEIRGVGPHLSGKYYVVSVKHDIGPSGYKMTFKARSEGTKRAWGARRFRRRRSPSTRW